MNAVPSAGLRGLELAGPAEVEVARAVGLGERQHQLHRVVALPHLVALRAVAARERQPDAEDDDHDRRPQRRAVRFVHGQVDEAGDQDDLEQQRAGRARCSRRRSPWCRGSSGR